MNHHHSHCRLTYKVKRKHGGHSSSAAESKIKHIKPEIKLSDHMTESQGLQISIEGGNIVMTPVEDRKTELIFVDPENIGIASNPGKIQWVYRAAFDPSGDVNTKVNAGPSRRGKEERMMGREGAEIKPSGKERKEPFKGENYKSNENNLDSIEIDCCCFKHQNKCKSDNTQIQNNTIGYVKRRKSQEVNKQRNRSLRRESHNKDAISKHHDNCNPHQHDDKTRKHCNPSQQEENKIKICEKCGKIRPKDSAPSKDREKHKLTSSRRPLNFGTDEDAWNSITLTCTMSRSGRKSNGQPRSRSSNSDDEQIELRLSPEMIHGVIEKILQNGLLKGSEGLEGMTRHSIRNNRERRHHEETCNARRCSKHAEREILEERDMSPKAVNKKRDISKSLESESTQVSLHCCM